MAEAYRAGVALKDMEFVQYHPTGLPGTGILITEASRGEGGWLKNKDGYRYLQDYGLGPPPINRRTARWSWARVIFSRVVTCRNMPKAARSMALTAITCISTCATWARK